MSSRAKALGALRSLVLATDLDVLPLDRVVERRDGYAVVCSPSNPGHFWGNFLLFDDPPAAGDGSRWERCFEAEFGGDPRVGHRAFGWDRVERELGSAAEEFVARGYETEETVGLIATPDRVRPHPRENRTVTIRRLDPRVGVDETLWAAVLELQVAERDARFEEQAHRTFTRRRLDDRRALFQAGAGAWYVALDPAGREVLASAGVVVAGGRGRFQVVDTKPAHRRQGICSRLVVEAAGDAARSYGAERLVIAADPGYHALGLYESLGFQATEHLVGVWRPSPTT